MTDIFWQYANFILLKLSEFQFKISATILQAYPRLSKFNNFEKFVVLNICLLIIYGIFSILSRISIYAIYKRTVQLIFQIPFVRNKIDLRLVEIKQKIRGSLPQYEKLKQIPNKPLKFVIQNTSQIQTLKGLNSGSRYPNKQHSEFVAKLARQFGYSNPLHLDLHPFVNQMQAEVVRMCSNLLNFKSANGESIGLITSGGTQSIFCAILAYKQHGIKYRNIKRPNLVIATTGHVAAHKASEYMQIEIRVCKVDKNYQMSLSSMKSCIDSNTICVYTSYPNYPYGTVDPIDKIAQYCMKRNLPVHVDMCLGGFIVPFLKNQNNQPMFQIPKGVTSISIDTHKYGLAAKGSSVILYSDVKYQYQQFFVTNFWPGGLYGTSGLAGSKSGVPVASAWISMMKTGIKGYTQNALQVQKAVLTLKKQLKELGCEIFGDPKICIVAFNHSRYSVNSIQIQMQKKGWHLSLCQKPICIHFSFTPLNSQKIQTMINDFKNTFQIIKTKSIEKDSQEIELYGACAKIPDNNTKNLILNACMDAYIDY